MTEYDYDKIADVIANELSHLTTAAPVASVHRIATELCWYFAVYYENFDMDRFTKRCTAT